jgi:adenylate kinase
VTALVLLGPPGGGKGTQGRMLAEDLRVPWLSSGALLRDAVREGTDVGRCVEHSLRRGELVDDDLMQEVMGERLRTADATGGFILDGFPRTRTQAEALARALDRIGVALTCALLLDVSDEGMGRPLALPGGMLRTGASAAVAIRRMRDQVRKTDDRSNP